MEVTPTVRYQVLPLLKLGKTKHEVEKMSLGVLYYYKLLLHDMHAGKIHNLIFLRSFTG